VGAAGVDGRAVERDRAGEAALEGEARTRDGRRSDARLKDSRGAAFLRDVDRGEGAVSGHLPSTREQVTGTGNVASGTGSGSDTVEARHAIADLHTRLFPCRTGTSSIGAGAGLATPSANSAAAGVGR